MGLGLRRRTSDERYNLHFLANYRVVTSEKNSLKGTSQEQNKFLNFTVLFWKPAQLVLYLVPWTQLLHLTFNTFTFLFIYLLFF